MRVRATLKAFFVALALFAHLPGLAGPATFTVVHVDTRTDRLELFLRDDKGAPFHRLDRLAAWLDARGQHLRFAMNAGMYEPDFAPVGLFVADGRTIAPLNLADGKGNFYLKPNGVFLVSATGPRIVASSKYPAIAHGVQLATQSGPLLVEDGVIHPGFDPDSTSRHVRNGVGVRGSDVYFAISDRPVTFHEMAAYFREVLRCPDALYFDGTVSSLYAPGQRRNDAKADLGPIIGVVDRKTRAGR